MKKFIVAFIALMFLLVVACGNSGSVQAEGAAKPEFELIPTRGTGSIIRHNETGVCYLLYNNANKAGLTVMVNPDGTPYVWEDNHE